MRTSFGFPNSIKHLLCVLLVNLCVISSVYSKITNYANVFDYSAINRNTFIPISGFDDQKNHHFTLHKHAFEIQKIVSTKTTRPLLGMP